VHASINSCCAKTLADAKRKRYIKTGKKETDLLLAFSYSNRSFLMILHNDFPRPLKTTRKLFYDERNVGE